MRGWLQRAGLVVMLGLGLGGGLAASQLLAGCSCAGADSQGNGITPIPIPGCSAGARSDGGYNSSDVAVARDGGTAPDAIISADVGIFDMQGPPLDAVSPEDTIAPPPPPDGGPPPSDAAVDVAPDGNGVDGGDAGPDGGPDGGDLGPDAVDGPVDAPAGDAVDGPPADLTGPG